MKNTIVFLTLALVFLAVVDTTLAKPNRNPGVVEEIGKKSSSSSDIESCSSDEKKEAVKVGGAIFEKGSKGKHSSQDFDSASGYEKVKNVVDDFGNCYNTKETSAKSSSVDNDEDCTSTYSKFSF